MTLSTKNVLVTGCDGFIGKHLVAELKSQDVNVVGVDLKKGVDITNWERVKQIEKVDLVYHLAAIVFVPFASENPKLTYDINVLGTLNLLEFCRIKGVDKFVFAKCSTSSLAISMWPFSGCGLAI